MTFTEYESLKYHTAHCELCGSTISVDEQMTNETLWIKDKAFCDEECMNEWLEEQETEATICPNCCKEVDRLYEVNTVVQCLGCMSEESLAWLLRENICDDKVCPSCEHNTDKLYKIKGEYYCYGCVERISEEGECEV